MAAKYYVFEVATGKLVSVGSEEPEGLPPGLSHKVIDDDNADSKVWDESGKRLVATPGRRIVDVSELFERLTEREAQVLLGLKEAEAPASLRALSRYISLAKTVNMDGPILRDALDELVNLNLLTTTRRAELTKDG